MIKTLSQYLTFSQAGYFDIEALSDPTGKGLDGIN